MAITMGLLFAVLFLALAFMIIFSLRRPYSRDQLKKTDQLTHREMDGKFAGSKVGGPIMSQEERKALDEKKGKEKNRVA